MTTVRSFGAREACLAVVLLAIPFAPGVAGAQCVGTGIVEDFASTMKGCTGTVEFAARASLCAEGWQACTAAQWVERHGGKVPQYNYWTNDNLRYGSTVDGCFVNLTDGEDCGDTPMRVCTSPRAERDGAYATDAHVYLIETFFADGSVTLVTAINRTTLASQTYFGTYSGDTFSGGLVSGPGSLTLSFTSDTGGSDGSATFTRMASQQLAANRGGDFNTVVDPLGNECNWHSCGLDTPTPNRYFGGCSGNTAAGVLCCQ